MGHAFDRGLGFQMGLGSRQNLEAIQKSFFETTFLLLGYVAKSDGHVSKSEIEHGANFCSLGSILSKEK